MHTAHVRPFATLSVLINSFGAGVGLNIPLGGHYAKMCNEYAKSLANKAKALADQAVRNDQLKLLEQCYWLAKNMNKRPSIQVVHFHLLGFAKNTSLPLRKKVPTSKQHPLLCQGTSPLPLSQTFPSPVPRI